MATFFRQALWSILCGTALGLGGCAKSGGNNPPEDAQADSDALDAEQEQDPPDVIEDTATDTLDAMDVPDDTDDDADGWDTVEDTGTDTLDATDPTDDTGWDATDSWDVVYDIPEDTAADVEEEETIVVLYGPPVALR